MTEKTPVKLVVSDIDNTISDYFNIWAQETGKGIEAVAASRGIDVKDPAEMKKVYDSIKTIPTTGAIFHDFARMVRETPIFSLEGKSAEERKRLEKSDAKIAHDFQVNYAKGKSMYEGVLETVKEARKNGAQFVLYTDSPEDGAIRSLVHMGFPIDQLDGLVCRANDADEILPNGKKAPMQIDGGAIGEYKKALKAKLGDKYVINEGNVWKPNQSVMQGILDRHGAKAQETVMVGDNIKSDGGFVVMGVNYAWQKEGSKVTDYSLKVNKALSNQPDYKLGPEAHLQLLAERGAKDPALAQAYKDHMVTLETGFGDLGKYFAFTDNTKAYKIEQYKESVRAEQKAQKAQKTAQIASKVLASKRSR